MRDRFTRRKVGATLLGCGLLFAITACEQEPAPATDPSPISAAGPLRAEVTHIVDGDTIDVRLTDGSIERIRFIGVDTPERGKPFAGKATSYTSEKARVGSSVYLVLDVDHRDRYGRLLAYVWLTKPESMSRADIEDNMLNALLLRQGLAVLLTIQPNSNHVDVFTGLQRRAREEGVNLWRQP